MTMPQHPPLSIKRKAVPLRGLVTLVYLYWYPVLSLRDRFKCCLRAVSQLGGISSHFRTKFGFLQFICVFLPLFLLKGPSFTVSLSLWSMGLPSSGWWWFLFITGCCCTVSLLTLNTTTGTMDSPDGPGWGSPGSGNGNWLISSCATRFNTVAL